MTEGWRGLGRFLAAAFLPFCAVAPPAAAAFKIHVANRPPSVVRTAASAEGAHFAWLAVSGGTETWLLDGREVYKGPQGSLTYFHELGRSCEAVLSRQGGLSFLVRTRRPAPGRSGFSVWREGSLGAEFEEIYELSLSPDGRRLAYAARRNGLWRVVLDGAEPFRSFSDFRPASLRVSDGGRVDYLARDGPAHLRMRGDVVLGTLASQAAELSADGEHTLAKEALRGAVRVLLDGRPAGDPHPAIRSLTLSPEGKRPAFFASPTADGPFQAVIGGRAAGPRLASVELEGEARFYFSPSDGRAFWFAKSEGSWSLFGEEGRQGRHERIVGKPALALSPSGKHRAYAAWSKKDGLRIFLDGNPTKDDPVSLLPGTGIGFDGEDEYHFFEQDAFGAVFLVCASVREGDSAPFCLGRARALAHPPKP